ncbi:9949_t:CDS:2, partial [Funneliformis geosporum]
YDIDWSGSVHDAKVYKYSSFYKQKNELIINDDYLLGDSAYSILPFLIIPFHLSTNQQQKKFNLIHSLHRVIIENAFGRLKARFVSLKDIWDLDLDLNLNEENQENNDFNDNELKLASFEFYEIEKIELIEAVTVIEVIENIVVIDTVEENKKYYMNIMSLKKNLK